MSLPFVRTGHSWATLGVPLPTGKFRCDPSELPAALGSLRGTKTDAAEKTLLRLL
jgi:hypothetical protein